MKKHTHTYTVSALCSAFHLGTSIGLHSLIGPQWMDCSSTSFSSHSCFFSPPFPSSPSLFLSPPPLCFLRHWRRWRKCREECVNPLSSLSSPSCLLFSYSFCPLWVKEVSQGPLNVHKRKRRAPLSFLYTGYRHWDRLNNPFVEGRASSGNIPQIKRGFSVIRL